MPRLPSGFFDRYRIRGHLGRGDVLTQAKEDKERDEPDAYRVEDDLVDLVELALLGLLRPARPPVRRVVPTVCGVLLDEPGPPRDMVRREKEDPERERRVR